VTDIKDASNFRSNNKLTATLVVWLPNVNGLKQKQSDHHDALILRGWRLSSRTWNPI